MRNNKQVNTTGLKRTARKLKLLVVLAFAVVATSVFFSVGSSAKGTELVEYERRISELESKNRELQAQIIEETALKRISEKAEGLSLGKAETIEYIGSGVSQNIKAAQYIQ